jgi:hypothetical protein
MGCVRISALGSAIGDVQWSVTQTLLHLFRFRGTSRPQISLDGIQ